MYIKYTKGFLNCTIAFTRDFSFILIFDRGSDNEWLKLKLYTERGNCVTKCNAVLISF